MQEARQYLLDDDPDDPIEWWADQSIKDEKRVHWWVDMSMRVHLLALFTGVGAMISWQSFIGYQDDINKYDVGFFNQTVVGNTTTCSQVCPVAYTQAVMCVDNHLADTVDCLVDLCSEMAEDFCHAAFYADRTWLCFLVFLFVTATILVVGQCLCRIGHVIYCCSEYKRDEAAPGIEVSLLSDDSLGEISPPGRMPETELTSLSFHV